MRPQRRIGRQQVVHAAHGAEGVAHDGSFFLRAVGSLHVILDDGLEIFGDAVAFQRHRFCAIDIHRRDRDFAGAGQADADVGVLAFAGAVDHAAHHRHVHGFDAGILAAPDRHLGAQPVLDVLRQFLEHRAGGAAAAGTGGDQRGERAHAHDLQDFLGDLDFRGARFARLRRQRNADGVADAFLQQHRQRRGRGDDALAAHAGFGQAQMQRVIAARGQIAIHLDQILHARHLARQDDAVARQAEFFGARGGIQRGGDQRIAHDLFRRMRLRPFGVLVHHARQQFLIQTAPVDADAHRLAVTRGRFDQGGELFVLLGAAPDVARVDAQLGERFGAFRHGLDQAVAVEMKVADQRHAAAQRIEFLAESRGTARAASSVLTVSRTNSEPACQSACTWATRAGDIGGIGIGHRLHHHRRTAADRHMADQDAACRAADDGCIQAHCRVPLIPKSNGPLSDR